MDAKKEPQPDDRQADSVVGQRTETPQRSRRRLWMDIVEERIKAAEERGEFANLPGAGKPLAMDVNREAGDNALAYSLLKANQMAPREITLGQEVDQDLALAESLAAELRRRRDLLAQRRGPVFASERRAYNIQVEKTATRYEAILIAARGKVLSLNIIAPAPLHRPQVDVVARMRAFRAEFPPLAE